jgi:hypothetical protein
VRKALVAAHANLGKRLNYHDFMFISPK